MKTGRIALALGLGVPGVALVIGFGCSAGGDQPARPRSAPVEAGTGGGTGVAGDTGAGGSSDSGSDDVSQGGGGTSGGTGGYDPYGSGGQSGGGQSGGGTGTGGWTGTGGTPCIAPNTAALKVNGPNVWNGKSTSVDNTSNVGYWYSYYDTSQSGIAVLPSNTSFGTGVVNGFIEASGLGAVTGWGGGIAVTFFNSSPATPADLSAYKGIVFQFKNSDLYGAHFTINTWDFDPKFCKCLTSGACFNDYGVDLPKAAVKDTVTSYWMCWPGITCTGPNPDASAEFPNATQVTLKSNMSGTVPFDPKRVTGLSFVSLYKTQWEFKLGLIRLF
jgi:hypothetical protein